MEGPLGIAVFSLVVIGLCVQAAVTFYSKYRKASYDAEKDADTIASELELQLQSELDDAIKSTVPVVDMRPDDGVPAATKPHVRFAGIEASLDDKPHIATQPNQPPVHTPGERPGPGHPFQSIRLPPTEETPSMSYLAPNDSFKGDAEPIFVNWKQFHRIMKRRVARQKLEAALRAHGRTKVLDSRFHGGGIQPLMRPPRDSNGRLVRSGVK